jgi:acetate kinase
MPFQKPEVAVIENDPFRILTVNSGSSSIKFSLYEMGPRELRRLSGQAERIGESEGLLKVKDGNGKTLAEPSLAFPDHRQALKAVLEWLKENPSGQSLEAVGHRLVHGGRRYGASQWVTKDLMIELRQLIPLAPAHLPHEIEAIEAIRGYYPEVKQAVSFDTAFHRKMPEVAQVYALPRNLWHEGILRYGFHGLSCEYVLGELAPKAGSDADDRRIIIAHLGHGCSMTAVRHGQSVDNTMGLTPIGGLVMSRRPGDLDPGVILYLLQQKGMSASEVSDLVNRKGGLIGISPRGDDMRDLLEREKEDPLAALAIAVFCHQAKKFLGALVAILGGLDTLVFTGGIGENAPAIRWRICDGLAFMGVRLDVTRNQASASVISRENSAVLVRVIRTNEELVIARHTYQLLRKEEGSEKSEIV